MPTSLLFSFGFLFCISSVQKLLLNCTTACWITSGLLCHQEVCSFSPGQSVNLLTTRKKIMVRENVFFFQYFNDTKQIKETVYNSTYTLLTQQHIHNLLFITILIGSAYFTIFNVKHLYYNVYITIPT